MCWIVLIGFDMTRKKEVKVGLQNVCGLSEEDVVWPLSRIHHMTRSATNGTHLVVACSPPPPSHPPPNATMETATNGATRGAAAGGAASIGAAGALQRHRTNSHESQSSRPMSARLNRLQGRRQGKMQGKGQGRGQGRRQAWYPTAASRLMYATLLFDQELDRDRFCMQVREEKRREKKRR